MTTQIQNLRTPIHSSSLGGSSITERNAPRRRAASWIWRDVVFPFAYTRLLLLAFAWFAIWRLPGSRTPGWDAPVKSISLDIWSHFDGKWYLSVARDGYQFIPGVQSSVAFTPLLPAMMKFGGALLGGSDTARIIVGLLVSNLALIGGLAYLMALMKLEGFDRATAARAVWYVLVFPTTLFLSAVYPMSLFFGLAIASFYYARTQRWPVAGILAGLAAAARPDGVLLAAALGVEYLHQRRFSWRDIRADILWLGLAPLSLVAWMGFQWWRFGTPLASILVQKAWHSATIQVVIHSSRAVMQLGIPALFAALTVVAFFRLRPCYSAFGISLLAVMLMAARFWSITRFVLVLFPAFMMLAMIGQRWRVVHYVYLGLSMPLSCYLMMRFALNHWVA